MTTTITEETTPMTTQAAKDVRVGAAVKAVARADEKIKTAKEALAEFEAERVSKHERLKADVATAEAQKTKAQAKLKWVSDMPIDDEPDEQADSSSEG